MEKQLNGSMADINKGGPHSVELDQTGIGKPEIQYVDATQADIIRSPFSVLPYNQDTGVPEKQFMGEMAPINRTPIRGWESADTPMSKRSEWVK